MTGSAIPEELLDHARKALGRFFSRKGCGDRLHDLVQQTLERVLKRVDYQFETDTDFLKVCHGFARMILKEDRRRLERTKADVEYDDSQSYAGSNPRALHGVEKELYYRRLYELLRPCLKDADWQMLEDSFEMDRETQAKQLGVSNANAMGVRIFRAMKKVRKRFHALKQTSL